MSGNISVNIALDASGALILLLMILPQFQGRQRGERRDQLLVAAILHFVALCMKIASGVSLALTGQPAETGISTAFVTAVVLDVLSSLALVFCVLSDADGRLRFRERQIPVSVTVLAAAILPPFLALSVGVFLIHVEPLGIAYAFSLHLVHLLLRQTTERELTRREESLNIQQARLMTEQMRPHFIFNTLSSIEMLCLLDPEAAAKCIEDFSGYLRGNIDALTSEELIPFDTELEHIREYIALEQADPGRRFTVDYQLAVRDFRIPALTVQPIVENAIKHGALSHTDGTGRVTVTTEEVGKFIRIIVEDNGKGGAAWSERRHRGVGIQNVEARLEAQCGGIFRLTAGETGARAVITVPKEGIGTGYVHTYG